jgi:hypothetical protein
VFLPREEASGPETSIMRTDSLGDAAVWALGDEVVAQSSGRPPRARADFLAPHVRACRLTTWHLNVEPKVPPPRHGRIIGWPPDSERDARRSLAQQLRAEAVLHVR